MFCALPFSFCFWHLPISHINTFLTVVGDSGSTKNPKLKPWKKTHREIRHLGGEFHQKELVSRWLFLDKDAVFRVSCFQDWWKKRPKTQEPFVGASDLLSWKTTVVYMYKYIPGTLWWPLFWLEVGPCFGGFKPQSRGHSQVPVIYS